MDHLFRPFTLKGHTIKNRIVMPPMEFLVRDTRDGFVHDGHLRHYGRRAQGGVGLIIVEATSIHPDSLSIDSQLGAWSDAHIPGLTRLAAEIHAHGAKALLQLQHLGVKMKAGAGKPEPIGPSAYSDGGDINARAMTREELHGLQDAYVDAALRAHMAGFDGVEFHGAHGYLLNQFTSPLVNRRTDEYGGSGENRLRFFREIFERVKISVGDTFLFSYRMGCNDPSLEDGIANAGMLERMGLDLLHVSSSGYSPGPLLMPESFPFNWTIYGAGQIREAINLPVIAVYEIRTPERAEAVLAMGLADFTSIGRELIVDPDWANKALREEEIRYCIRCKPCVVFSGERCVML